MCGISGIIGGSGAFDAEKEIGRLVESIRHRGPDSSGIFHDQDRNVWLGHTRLSINDLSEAGSQPMVSTSGRYVIVLNGEIYNFLELRERLEVECPGEAWVGHSDTEVLLRLIECVGVEKALNQVDGMFALAVLDKREDVLYLAVDAFAEKPLYYYQGDELFIFSSEFNYFAACHCIDRELDRAAISDYFDHKYILAPATIFRSVKKLGQGELVCVPIGGTLSCQRSIYRNIHKNSASRLTTHDISFDEAVEQVEGALALSVKRRMISDRPLGALLSSGVDSSLICAVANEQGKENLRTFTVSFGGVNDEGENAAKIAESIGTAHDTVEVNNNELLDIVQALPDIYGEPFCDPSQIPTVAIARHIKQHLDVVLTGDGADELFGGYRRYFHTARFEARVTPFRRVASAISSFPFFTRKGKFADLVRAIGSNECLDVYRFFHSLKLSGSLLSRSEMDEKVSRGLDIACSEHPIARYMAYDLASYLPGDILAKLDRASMSVALEGRIPFLSTELLDVSRQLPLDYLFNDSEGKLVLKRLLEQKVGVDLRGVVKKGFSSPLTEWFSGELKPWLERYIFRAKENRFDIYDTSEIDFLFRRFIANPSEVLAHKLWAICVFEQWMERYFD